MKNFILMCLCVSGANAAEVPQNCDGTPVLWKRFEAEYPAAVERLRASSNHLRISAQRTDRSVEAGNRLVEGRYEVTLNVMGDRCQIIKTAGNTEVISYSPELAFSLKKVAEDGHFAVTGVFRDESEKKKIRALLEYEACLFAWAAHRMFELPVECLLDPSIAKIECVEEISVAAEKAMRIHFRPRKLGGVDVVAEEARGVVDLLPELDWAIASYEMTFSYAEKPGIPASTHQLRSIVRCQRRKNGAVPATIEFQDKFTNSAGEGYDRNVVQENSQFEEGGIQAEQFTLSAFDLPSLDGVSSPHDGRRVWVLSLSIVLFLTALAIAWKYRSRART